MTTQLVDMTDDRQALRDWEAAKAEAESKRKAWLSALECEFGIYSVEGTRTAILYAMAANNAELLRQRYEDAVMAALADEARVLG